MDLTGAQWAILELLFQAEATAGRAGSAMEGSSGGIERSSLESCQGAPVRSNRRQFQQRPKEGAAA